VNGVGLHRERRLPQRKGCTGRRDHRSEGRGQEQPLGGKPIRRLRGDQFVCPAGAGRTGERNIPELTSRSRLTATDSARVAWQPEHRSIPPRPKNSSPQLTQPQKSARAISCVLTYSIMITISERDIKFRLCNQMPRACDVTNAAHCTRADAFSGRTAEAADAPRGVPAIGCCRAIRPQPHARRWIASSNRRLWKLSAGRNAAPIRRLPAAVRLRHAPAMFVVSEAEATAIRAAFEQSGELAAAVELRRLFPGVTDTMEARESARTIAGWKPLPTRPPRSRHGR
jgi:hypothetical protein